MLNGLKDYEKHLLSQYQNLPQGRYVNLILVRETESEAIFRTEGSGEPLNREMVIAGIEHKEPISRVIISKRKQIAVERRTGRELLRRHGLLALKGKECMLNTNSPCEQCVDCWVYGYAVGGGGAQKARVISEEAFSLLSVSSIVDTKTFNALFDNSTMRHPVTGEPSTSLGSSEYVKPGVHFLDIMTLKDVTPNELAYVIMNILASKRYGAISSRIGRMKNHLVGIIFSQCEIFSSLELTQYTYDLLGEAKKGPENLDHPLVSEEVITAVRQATNDLIPRVIGGGTIMTPADLDLLLKEISELYQDPTAFLLELTRSYPKNQDISIVNS